MSRRSSVVFVVGWAVACSGSDGGAGADGADGADGANGANGFAGLVQVRAEAAGENCATGGQRIESGTDRNANNVLDVSEVSATSYVCNGSSGADGSDGVDGVNGQQGFTSLTSMVNELAGANCEFGGIRINRGVDNDGDNELDELEVVDHSYLCGGQEGRVTLFNVTADPDGQCGAGGEKIEYGVDEDRSGTLDLLEVTGSRYVCHGAQGDAGHNALFVVSEAALDVCPAGGKQIAYGLDSSGDGVLAVEEYQDTTIVCNGVDGQNGTDGLDGFNALVQVTAAASCDGHDVAVGLDNGQDGGTARDGTLQSGEVDTTSTFCFASAVSAYDANGTHLGRVIELPTPGISASDYVLLSPTGYIYSLQSSNLRMRETGLYFSGASCTGTPHALAYSDLADQQLVNFAIANSGSVYKNISASRANVSHLSYKSNNNCISHSGSTSLYQVELTTATAVGVPSALQATAPISTE